MTPGHGRKNGDGASRVRVFLISCIPPCASLQELCVRDREHRRARRCMNVIPACPVVSSQARLWTAGWKGRVV